MRLVLTRSHVKIIQYMLIGFLLTRFCSFDFIDGIIMRIHSISSILVTVYFVLKFLYTKNFVVSWKKDGIVLTIILYSIILVLFTIINSGDLYTVFASYYPIIGTACFIDLASQDNPYELISSYAIFLFVALVANLFEGLLFRDNSTAYANVVYLMGGQNKFGLIIAITVAFVSIYCNLGKKTRTKKIFSFFTPIVAIATALMMKSATTIVCTFIILLFNYVPGIVKLTKKISALPCFIVYLIIWFALIVYRLQYLFAGIIENVLNRNVSLTSRTDIWDLALVKIKESFWFGYGMQKNGNFFQIVNPNGAGFSTVRSFSAHNQILQNMYEGGFVLLLVFIMVFFLALGKKRVEGKVSNYFVSALIAILVNCLTEAPGMYGIFMLLVFCFYSTRFDLEDESEELS